MFAMKFDLPVDRDSKATKTSQRGCILSAKSFFVTIVWYSMAILLLVFHFREAFATDESGDQPSDAVKSAADIFRARIVPLLKSPDQSSCSECHLRGVELRDFLAEDQQQTFVNLRARGWIDVEHPEKSKLLEFIERHSDDSSPIMKRVREAELIAVKSWITAAVREPDLLRQPIPTDSDLTLPTEFIRFARHDQVLARFSEAIWSQLQRCAGCHSPERNQQQVKKNGENMSWIVPRDPSATLSLLLERNLIDVEHPEESELRTKPLGLVKHGGGPKFIIGGQTDQPWLAFLEEYAKLVRGGYSPTDLLPKVPDRRSWLSEMQLKITDLPADWRGRLLAISLHPKNTDGSWSEIPIATADSPVNQKQLVWQHALTIYASVQPDIEPAGWAKPLTAEEAIPAGRYQLRVRLGRLVVSEDLKPVEPSSQPDPLVLVATSELNAPWRTGYQPPMILRFSEFQPAP